MTLAGGQGYYACYARPYADDFKRAYAAEWDGAARASDVQTVVAGLLANAQAGDADVVKQLVEAGSALAGKEGELHALLEGRRFSVPVERVAIRDDRAEAVAVLRKGEAGEDWTVHLVQSGGYWRVAAVEGPAVHVEAAGGTGAATEPATRATATRAAYPWVDATQPAPKAGWLELYQAATKRISSRPDTPEGQLPTLRDLQWVLDAHPPRGVELDVRNVMSLAMSGSFLHHMDAEAIAWLTETVERFKDVPTADGELWAKVRLAELLSVVHDGGDREEYRPRFTRLLVEVLDTPVDKALVETPDGQFLSAEQIREAGLPVKQLARGGAAGEEDQALKFYREDLERRRVDGFQQAHDAAARVLARAQWVKDRLDLTRDNLLKLQGQRKDDAVYQKAVADYRADIESAIRRFGPGKAAATEPATQKAEGAAAAKAKEPPVTDDVVLSAEPEKPEVAMGDPLLVTLRFRNVGKQTYWLEEDHFGTFHTCFVVRDAAGKVLDNPYRASVGAEEENGPVSEHELKPGGEVAFTRMLNECVRFEKPGVYTVEALDLVRTQAKYEEGVYRRPKTVTGTIRVKDYDRAKRAADIDALVAAYKAGGALPPNLPFDQEYLFNGSREGIVRLLAFFDEPRLIPFFLDVLEDADWNGYAKNGLTGLSDRAAVLKGFEERLDHPERHDAGHLIDAYTELKYPLTDWNDPTNVKETYARRRALEEKYRARRWRCSRQTRSIDTATWCRGWLRGRRPAGRTICSWWSICCVDRPSLNGYSVARRPWIAWRCRGSSSRRWRGCWK